MSERGVFAVDRGVWEHDVLASDEPFTKREAWMWLISEAAWKPHKRRILGQAIQLKRGQLVGSVRYLAEKWKWSKSTVHRFLDVLKNETMIGTEIGTGVLVITICNYDEYQKVSLPIGTLNETRNGTGAGQERDNREYKEYRERDSVSNDTAVDAAKPIYTDSRHELWGEGVPILVSMGEAEGRARSMIGAWLKQTRDDAQTVLGAIQRARDARVVGPIAWITKALRIDDGKRNSENRANQDSRTTTTGHDAILAGVGRIADRIDKRRSSTGPADGSLPFGDDAPVKPDVECFAAQHDRGSHATIIAFARAGPGQLDAMRRGHVGCGDENDVGTALCAEGF